MGMDRSERYGNEAGVANFLQVAGPVSGVGTSKAYFPQINIPPGQTISNTNIQVGGVKYDKGKAPLASGCIAYFGKALEEIADISAYGALKYCVPYSDQNWRKVDSAPERYANACLRHLTAYLNGEANDPESNKRHLAHAGWNILALLELVRP